MQRRGVTQYAGLYFVGLPWLHNAKSGLIYGVSEDAAYIASRIIGPGDEGNLEEEMELSLRGI